mmetsp:Transcript_14929/g.30517  ORF Transcript_14929/g.30517 Transcript_14929/m.30517 type:complete len:201 (+) Transcript_14929:183-785(+)
MLLLWKVWPRRGGCRALHPHQGRFCVPTALQLEVEGARSKGAIEAVLLNLNKLSFTTPLGLLLKYQNRVSLLRCLGAPVDRGHAQFGPLILFSGVTDNIDMDITLRRKFSKLLNGDILHVKLIKGGAYARDVAGYHELQIIQNDVLHIVHIHGILHRINDVVNVRPAMEFHEVQRQRVKAVCKGLECWDLVRFAQREGRP